ncbi:LuxR C-terminal-related transcriptional regulator [Streptomyces sp. NBC_01210]|uniref:ATP-binding protein n=1 Tax=Streptomyces sp. NBC_01210 TaxID=2903774 RepID=UPI002E1547F1|nr:LuxR C-terminal-related transcriptional regulator [Streptomyces sp. NBC_01210]
MAVVAPSVSTRRQEGRLPAEVTSFVGRRHEVAEVRNRLSGSRLVTLTGVGGVGKTRLASHVAAEVRSAFADGVWLVELAGLENSELLTQTVAEALEIRDHSSRGPLDILTEHLRDKRTLVILDNCEHLLPQCAVLADSLLRSAPDLKILATSRQVLGLPYEHTLAVPTLGLPSTGKPRLSLKSLARCDAVRLFTERAGAVLPGFSVTEANREAVERICRQLDGIPLGIELAVVRLRALSVQQLLERLDDRFQLLTAGSRAVLPRHQTLRALIDWSYVLCTGQERLLWARASVFTGGFDLEAAEEICSGDGISREEVLDVVTGLVDKSVLLREEPHSTVRYRLLDTLRQYGREQLVAAGQTAPLQRRHRDYYRRLAAEARAELFGPSQVAWFARLHLEHTNLRTALEQSFAEPGEAETGLSMASDLLYHWITSYYLGEGRRWLDEGLAVCTEPNQVRARALWTNSWLAVIQSETAAAAAMLEESGKLGKQLADESVVAYTALYSGMIAMYRGDAESAIGLYEDAVARHQAVNDPVGLALALIRLSLVHSFLGDSPRAIAFGEESLRVCDTYGEGWHRAYTTMALGIEVWRQGDARRAAELEKASLIFNRSLDDPLGVGVNLEVLAWIAATEEQYERAARLLGVLQTVWQAIGAPLSGYGHLVKYHDECESRTSQALGATAFRAAVRKGSRLSYGEALGYALEEHLAAEPSGEDERPSPLTRRETEIARLVAQGLSNKEIAATLVIAQRTAEGHIEHILSKLGFTSRAQVAVWVFEHDRAADGDERAPQGGP